MKEKAPAKQETATSGTGKPRPRHPKSASAQQYFDKTKGSREILNLCLLTGLTPSEMGVIVGVKAVVIAQYLQGKHEVTLNTVKKWCSMLEVNIVDLFTEQEQKQEK